MIRVTPAVTACLAAYRGPQVVVELVLASSGVVSTATVVAPGAPADEGSATSDVMLDAETSACVADAAMEFRVPPFERETFLVRYPFRAR